MADVDAGAAAAVAAAAAAITEGRVAGVELTAVVGLVSREKFDVCNNPWHPNRSKPEVIGGKPTSVYASQPTAT